MVKKYLVTMCFIISTEDDNILQDGEVDPIFYYKDKEDILEFTAGLREINEDGDELDSTCDLNKMFDYGIHIDKYLTLRCSKIE